MTGIDKDNFIKDEQLPTEFNDAHVSLRGFKHSTLDLWWCFLRVWTLIVQKAFWELDVFPDLRRTTLKSFGESERSPLFRFIKKWLWFRIESNQDWTVRTPLLLPKAPLKLRRKLKQSSDHDPNQIHTGKKALGKRETYSCKSIELKNTVQGGVGTAEDTSWMEHYQVGIGLTVLISSRHFKLMKKHDSQRTNILYWSSLKFSPYQAH
jgi:hypothetical protein